MKIHHWLQILIITFYGTIVTINLHAIERIQMEQLRFINEQADTVNVISCRMQNADEGSFMHCLYDNY